MITPDEHNAKIDRLRAKLEAQPAMIAYIMALYQMATIPPESKPTPDEINQKWKANAALAPWLRSSLPQILELWAAANAVVLNPGGRANQRLVTAVKRMPGCDCGCDV